MVIDPEVVDQIKTALGQSEPISKSGSDDDAIKVNIVIGKFQPFNNGHLKMIKKANSNRISFEKKMTDKNYTFIPKFFEADFNEDFGLKQRTQAGSF